MTEAAAGAFDIRKRFGATLALDGASFAAMAGEIHALVGENGAGKSTLVRILGGVHRPDEGRVTVGGRDCRFAGPRDAIAAGIVAIPQELRLVPALSIAENLALGDLPVRRLFGAMPVIDRARMRAEARARLAAFGLQPDVDRPVGRLAFAEQQIVAIAKALRRHCRVLMLDEPTAALEAREIARLFDLLRSLKERGTAIIYVSHRLEEIVTLADCCTVLRDGRVAAFAQRGEFSAADLVHAMTGRAEARPDDRAATVTGKVLLEDATPRDDAVRVHGGEIVGLAGLLGSGADRLLRRLFGTARSATVARINGRDCRLNNPAAAIGAGIGMVPGARRLGLVMNQSVRDNILLPSLGRLRRGAGDRLVAELMELLDIRPRRPALKASALSGGNQQKVIIAKWLARRVDVLLLDEPTQGVDVAAKAQIHALLRDFAARGGGVLVNSSDLSELVRLCDTVLAMRRGAIAAHLARADGLDEERVHAAIVA
jgi:ribose transport system ATP-binding protein